jgi:branched-chain amino acid transport system ATP-binding protein
MPEMLRVEALQKSFGSFMAVNGVHLQVDKGDLVAVIGPNGAGKTTLFNLVTGHLKPDRGRILFKGEEIGGMPPYHVCRRGMTRSFQIVNIFPRLTVFENVQVAVLSQKRKTFELFRPAERFVVYETNRILDNVGLTDKAAALAGSLSHGDQKVLEIAIALGNEPEMLILDEPTAGMSPEETTAALGLIRQLANVQGLTILFCEHDMEVVFSIARSIMVMHQGRTLVQGHPEEVRGNKEVEEAYLGAH